MSDELEVQWGFSIQKMADGNYRLAAEEGTELTHNQIFEAVSVAKRDLEAQAAASAVQATMMQTAMQIQQAQESAGKGKSAGGVVLPNG